MKLTTYLDGKSLVIALHGELDECNADFVRKNIDYAIVNTPFDVIIFDMGAVNFMDSTGIGVLLGRYNLLKRMGIAAFIKNCNKHIDRILTMSGVYRVIKKIS